MVLEQEGGGGAFVFHVRVQVGGEQALLGYEGIEIVDSADALRSIATES